MHSLRPGMLTIALLRAFPGLVEYLPPEPGPDHIVATLVEADIFAVATTITDERTSNDALIAHVMGDKPALTPAVLNGLLHILGIFPDTVFERLNGELVCTRATVDELIRCEARIERDAPAGAELREACEELEAFFKRKFPGAPGLYTMGVRRWSDNPRYETKPPAPVSAILPKKPGGVLSAAELALQKRRTHRLISRIFGYSAVMPAFSPQAPEPESGSVLCELRSAPTAARHRFAAPVEGRPRLASGEPPRFTHNNGQQETPDQPCSLPLYYCVIRPSQSGIGWTNVGLVHPNPGPSLVVRKWPRLVLNIFHCRGPPGSVQVPVRCVDPEKYSSMFVGLGVVQTTHCSQNKHLSAWGIPYVVSSSALFKNIDFLLRRKIMSKGQRVRHYRRTKRLEWAGFPMRALPEWLYQLAMLLYERTQAPFPMIISLLLTAISLAAQGGYDVQGRKNSSPGPVSLYILILASSGERKSTLDRMIMRIFREENRRLLEQYEQDRLRYLVEIEIWKAEKKAFETARQRAIKDGKDTGGTREALKEHLYNKPVAPVKRQVLYEDTTERALLEGLQGRGISAGLISDEGGNVLKKNLFSNPANLNTLWGGRDCYVNRMDGSVPIVDPRFTVSLQIQPELWLHSPKLADHFIRESGLIARFLVCYPESTQGTRFEDDTELPPLSSIPEWLEFEALLEKLLREGQNNGGKRKVLNILEQAHLLNLCNQTEGELNEGFALDGFRDVGSKVGENVQRLAALFHLCSREDDDDLSILPGCVENAFDLCVWYANQSMALPEAPEVNDAHMLLKWMSEHCDEERWYRGFPVSDLLTYGPNALRDNGRMKRAMLKLLELYPDRFRLIETQGRKSSHSGPRYFVTHEQFGEYWDHHD
ncbi:hypothetical protein CB172_13110 [Salmonella enterica subsp. enterica serovar Claibornei]|nr:hypothetical protein [Salmonella enterica subsp. enterica serovar Claibornei]